MSDQTEKITTVLQKPIEIFKKLPVPTPKEITLEMAERLPTLIIGSLTLVAALAWNDSIKTSIDYFLPPDSIGLGNISAKIIYALVLSFIVIILISLVLSVSLQIKKYFNKN